MFDALMFLAGAVLFFMAVLFFIFNWWERGTVSKGRASLVIEQRVVLEKNVELEIWQKELQVWHDTLGTEQRQLEEACEEFRMLVASQDVTENHILSAPSDDLHDGGALLKQDRWGKNLKRRGQSFDKQELP